MLHLLSHIKFYHTSKYSLPWAANSGHLTGLSFFLESPFKPQRDENKWLARRFPLLIYVLHLDFGLLSYVNKFPWVGLVCWINNLHQLLSNYEVGPPKSPLWSTSKSAVGSEPVVMSPPCGPLALEVGVWNGKDEEGRMPGTMHDIQKLNNYFYKKQNKKLMETYNKLPGL